MVAGKYEPTFKRKRNNDDEYVYRQEVGSDNVSGLVEESYSNGEYLDNQVYKAEQPTQQDLRNAQANYAKGSYAEQQRSGSYNYAYAHSGREYGAYGPRVTRIGFGGAPGPDEHQGLGVGRTIGKGVSTVVGTIFKPINYVMNGGVNALRGIEEETGVRGLGVGYQQNPGRSYGRENSNVFVTGSYSSENRGGGYSSGYDSRPGIFSSGRPARQQVSTRGDVNINGEPRHEGNSGFFTADSSFYYLAGEDGPSLSGAKNSIFVKDEATSAFIDGYNIALGEYRAIEAARAQNEQSMGQGASFHYPASAQARQSLGKAIFEATMINAANNPDEWPANTHIAGKEYLNEIRSSKSNLKISNVEDKSTINKLQYAYGLAAKTNEGVEELTKIIRSSSNESTLTYKLDNYIYPARRELVNNLDDSKAQAHYALATAKFTDPNAISARNVMLSNTAIWTGSSGISTDSDAQRFSIVVKDGTYALRMNNGDKEPIYADIPEYKWEETFALVAKQSKQDKAKDIEFKDSASELLALVETFDTSAGDEFIDLTNHAIKDLEEEARRTAEQKAAEEEAKKQAEQARKEAIDKANSEVVARANEVQTGAASLTKLKNDLSDKQKEAAQIAQDVAKNPTEENIRKASSIGFNIAELEHDISVASAKLKTATDALETAQKEAENVKNDKKETKTTSLSKDAGDYLVLKTKELTDQVEVVNKLKDKRDEKSKEIAAKVSEFGSKPTPEQINELKRLGQESAEINAEVALAVTKLEKVSGELELVRLDSEKAAQQARTEQKQEEKEQTSQVEKPTPEQIDAAATGIIEALRTNGTVKLGESIGLFNAAQSKQEIINNINSGMTPEQAIQQLNSLLAEKGVKLDEQQKELIARAVDNLGVNIRGQLVSNDVQQSVNPSSGLASSNSGPLLS